MERQKWWEELEALFETCQRGCDVPCFGANEMDDTASIIKRVLAILKAEGFDIQACYGGASMPWGSAQRVIGKHLDTFNNVGMDGIKNGDGQKRAFAIRLANLGQYKQDGKIHEAGVGAEATFLDRVLAALSELFGRKVHVLNRDGLGNSVHVDKEFGGSLIVYVCLYSRVPSEAARNAIADRYQLALGKGEVELGKKGQKTVRWSPPCRLWLVNWCVEQGGTGHWGPCAAELKAAFPDEPEHDAEACRRAYRLLAPRVRAPTARAPGSGRDARDAAAAAETEAVAASLTPAACADLVAALAATDARAATRAPLDARAAAEKKRLKAEKKWRALSERRQRLLTVVARAKKQYEEPEASERFKEELVLLSTTCSAAAVAEAEAAFQGLAAGTGASLATTTPPTAASPGSASTATSSASPPACATKKRSFWSSGEKARFLEAYTEAGCSLKGEAGTRVVAAVGTRTLAQVRSHAQKFKKKLKKKLEADDAAASSPTTTPSPPASTKRPRSDDAAAPASSRKKPLPPAFAINEIPDRVFVFSGDVYIDGVHVPERILRRLISHLGGVGRKGISYSTDYVITNNVGSKDFNVEYAASHGAIVVSDAVLSELLEPGALEKAKKAYLANLKHVVLKTLASLTELDGARVVVTGRDQDLDRVALCAALRFHGATTFNKLENVKEATLVVRGVFNAGVTATEKLIEARLHGIPVVEVADLVALGLAAAPAPCASAAPSTRKRPLGDNSADVAPKRPR